MFAIVKLRSILEDHPAKNGQIDREKSQVIDMTRQTRSAASELLTGGPFAAREGLWSCHVVTAEYWITFFVYNTKF